LSGEGIQAIYREIMSASISLQKDISIAYLGPQGTYSHQAATQRFGDCVAYSEQASIADVVDAVESGTVTYGVIPFENSTFGSVQQTLDRLIHCTDSVKVFF
jgi:chorismate mutase/prephenate dehydratase